MVSITTAFYCIIRMTMKLNLTKSSWVVLPHLDLLCCLVIGWLPLCRCVQVFLTRNMVTWPVLCSEQHLAESLLGLLTPALQMNSLGLAYRGESTEDWGHENKQVPDPRGGSWSVRGEGEGRGSFSKMFFISLDASSWTIPTSEWLNISADSLLFRKLSVCWVFVQLLFTVSDQLQLQHNWLINVI